MSSWTCQVGPVKLEVSSWTCQVGSEPSNPQHNYSIGVGLTDSTCQWVEPETQLVKKTEFYHWTFSKFLICHCFQFLRWLASTFTTEPWHSSRFFQKGVNFIISQRFHGKFINPKSYAAGKDTPVSHSTQPVMTVHYLTSWKSSRAPNEASRVTVWTPFSQFFLKR